MSSNPVFPRAALSVAIVSALAQLPQKAQAEDFSCVSDGTNFTWNTAANWNTCNGVFPDNNGFIFDATINAGTVTLNTNVELEDLTLGGGNVTQTSGIFEVTGAANIGSGSTYSLTGGRIVGGTWNTTGTGVLRVGSASSANFFDGMTINGDVDMTSLSRVRVDNGLTLNGTILLETGSDVVSNGTNLFDGNGTIQFGNVRSDFYLDGGGTTTIGANFAVEGENGTIGNQVLVSGNQVLVNNGRVSANVSGGQIELTASPVTNNNLLEAQNGGQLLLSASVTQGASGDIVAGNGSTVRMNNVTVSGGDIITQGTGVLTATSASNNFLDNVNVNGNIDMSALSRIRVSNNLNMDGRIDIDNGSDIFSEATNTFSGNTEIVFGGTVGSAANNFYLDNNGTTTLGANVVVRGENGTIGNQALVGGTQTLINNGRISADVMNGEIVIADSAVTNNGILEAQNGGQLTLSTNVTSGVGSQIIAGANSVVLQNGVTVQGEVNATGTGSFRPTNNSNNFLDGVTFNGNLDMSSALSRERVINDLELNGEITIDANSDLFSEATNVFSGNGTIIFGSSSVSGNNFYLDNSGTTTLGSNIVIRGENGSIGGQALIGGTQTLINNGRISADVNGGQIEIRESEVTNNGVLEAINGAQLTLSSDVTGNSGSEIRVGAGSTVLQNGITISGEINTTGSGMLRPINSSNNFLDGVTLNGNLDMASNLSRERIINNLELNGEISVNENSDIFSQGTNAFTGNGTIVFGDSTVSGNNFYLDDSGTTTIGSDFVIRGENGTIGNQALIGGTQTLVNNGRISADVSGGQIVIADSEVTNNSLLEAQNGGQLTLSSNVTNAANGDILAGDGSTVRQNGITIEGGEINSAGSGVMTASFSTANTLDGVTVNGTIDMASGSGFNNIQNDITINGAILLDFGSDIVIAGTNMLDGTGEIVFGSSGGKNLYLDNNGTTTVGADLTIRGENGTIGNQIFVGGDQILSVDGLVTADVATGILGFSDSDIEVNAGGTIRAENGGTIQFNNVDVDNQGLIEALDGSAVNSAISTTFSNNMSGDLVGGVWRAEDTGNGATITLRGANITTNSADVTLKGANALVQVVSTSIEDTLDTNNGSLRLQDGQNFNAIANAGAFTNNGLLEVTDSTFESTSLQHDGTINSFGNSAIVSNGGNKVAGTGDINSSFGALSIADGVNISGTLTTNGTMPTAGSVDLTGSSSENTVGTLANNGAIELGAQDLRVLDDYTNDNFGSGNAFNNRANVTGGGQVIGDNASQAITGDVSPAGANVVDLDLGNVRGGTSTTVNYQIANDGTGADIRGAVQTAAGGGNVTDARLSGSGVTAANFGPIAAGADSGNLAVTFDATTGGALTGQSIAVVSNFDNVATDIINISGVATTLAQGNATPNSNPVDLGNFRVGGAAPSQDFSVQNTSVAAATTEQLGIASVNTSGNFAATNNLGAGFIAGGASQAGAVSASVSGGTAGLNNGSVSVQYTTNGQLIDAGFGTINANDQTINLQATGFNAAVGQTTPAPSTNLGNTRVGGSLTQQLTVANIADLGAFSEDLDASFGASTGDASNNGGSVAGIVAGGFDASSLSASLDTTTSGAKSGNVTVNYATTGEVNGVSNGLGSAAAESDTIMLTGNVYQVAEGTLNTAPLNFGTVQVGQVVAQALSFTNSATGAAGFVEDLNVAAGTTSGAGGNLISASGSINGLLAGATDNSSITVNVNTSAAASINGAIEFNYESAGAVNGVSNGLGTLAVGSDSFGVIGTIQAVGQVVDQAAPVINNGPFNLGNLRMGSMSPTAFVDVTNMATGNDQAALDASIAGNGLVTAAGSFQDLAPGGNDNSSLSVGVNTGTAGAINGTATLSFVSDASNIGNCAPNCELNLVSQDVGVTANVYRLANPDLNTTNVTLAARVGDSAPTALVSVSNTSADQFTEALDAAFGTVAAGFSGQGSINALAAQGTDNSSLSVGLASTATSGSFAGTAAVDFESNGAGTTGEANISVGSQLVNLVGRVYEAAEAAVNNINIDFGTVRVGDTAQIQEQISNVASGALVDDLIGDFNPAAAPFSADAGDLASTGVGAGGDTDLTFTLDTGASGTFAEDVVLNLASSNDDLADLGLDGIQFGLTGTVNELANPTLQLDGGDATLTGGGTLYDLVFDTVLDTADSLLVADLSVLNDVMGPADNLDALFDISGTGVFDAIGFNAIDDLIAGSFESGFQIMFDTSLFGPGSFMGEILLNPTSVFAGLMDVDLDQITLRLSGRINATGQVPVPGTIFLVLGPALVLVYRRRKGTV